MKLPNILSLSRIVFLFIVAALFQSTFPGAATAALFLFIVAALTDWADGYVARRFNMITDFGKLMDALADKVLMVGMFVVLLAQRGLGYSLYGTAADPANGTVTNIQAVLTQAPEVLPRWAIYCVLIIIGREFLITGLRLVAASKGLVIAAEKGGKWKTVFQILAIGFLMLAHALVADFNFSPVALSAADAAWYDNLYSYVRQIGLILFLIATVLTFVSGYSYMAKYRHVFSEK